AIVWPPSAGINQVRFLRSAAPAALSARSPELPRLVTEDYAARGRRSRRPEELADLGQERARTERLRHVGIGAGGKGLGVVAAERVRGDDDQRGRAERGVGLDPARGFVAVDARELD